MYVKALIIDNYGPYFISLHFFYHNSKKYVHLSYLNNYKQFTSNGKYTGSTFTLDVIFFEDSNNNNVYRIKHLTNTDLVFY